ncbi:MAG: hypothetical protein ACQETL_09560 [Bacteroidota bacterium]
MHYFLKLKNYYLLSLLFAFIFINNGNAQDAQKDFQDLLKGDTEHFKLLKTDYIKKGPSEYFIKAIYNYEEEDVEVPVLIEYPNKSNAEAEGYDYMSDIHKMNYYIDKSAVKAKVGRNKMYGLRDVFKELENKEGYIDWQINHGNMVKDLPALSLFPLDLKDFRLSTISLPSASSTSYKSFTVFYTTPLLDDRIEVNIDHGLKARLNFEGCDKSSPYTVEGKDFFTDKIIGKRKSLLMLEYYQDGVRIEIKSPASEDRKIDDELEELKPFLQAFDMEAIQDFDFPNVKQPFAQVPFESMDVDFFREIFTNNDENYELKEVTTFDDKMIVTYHLIYKPENADIKLHLAYGDFKKEIKSSFFYRPELKRFNSYVEFDCSLSGIDDSEKRNVISDKFLFDQKKVTRWEKENIDFSNVNSLADLGELQVGEFELTEFKPELDKPKATFAYENENGEEVKISLTYGDDAARQYHRFQLITFDENNDAHSGQLSIDGRTFEILEMRKNFVAYLYKDFFQIGVLTDNDEGSLEDSKALIESFLEEFSMEKAFAWEAPDDYEMSFNGKTKDGTDLCLDTECMEEKLKNCETAAFGGRLNRKLGVIYKIKEMKEGGCQLSMVYTHNPNKDWVDKPLYFSIPGEESFSQEVIQKVTDCMEGKDDDCSGPLLDEIE